MGVEVKGTLEESGKSGGFGSRLDAGVVCKGSDRENGDLDSGALEERVDLDIEWVS
jgi:hypothetical protein